MYSTIYYKIFSPSNSGLKALVVNSVLLIFIILRYLHKIVIMSLRSCRNLCQAKKLIQWSNGIGGKHCTRQYLSVDNGDHCHHVFLNLGIFLASLKLISLQAEECVSKAENHNSFCLSFFSFCMSLFTLIKFIMLWIFIFFEMTIHTLSSFSFQVL